MEGRNNKNWVHLSVATTCVDWLAFWSGCIFIVRARFWESDPKVGDCNIICLKTGPVLVFTSKKHPLMVSDMMLTVMYTLCCYEVSQSASTIQYSRLSWALLINDLVTFNLFVCLYVLPSASAKWTRTIAWKFSVCKSTLKQPPFKVGRCLEN